jgi:predicted DNA-binding protein with PD1-like motif
MTQADAQDAPGPLEPLPVRLLPGDDLRARLEAIVGERGIAAAFVLSGIGSLSCAAVAL